MDERRVAFRIAYRATSRRDISAAAAILTIRFGVAIIGLPVPRVAVVLVVTHFPSAVTGPLELLTISRVDVGQ